MVSAEDLGFELLPAVNPIEPAVALTAASDAAVEPERDAQADEQQPLGYTWRFDWDAGRMYRQGAAPARISGDATLEEWCLMVVYSARGVHPTFSDDFGPDRPTGDGLGTLGAEAEAIADDWRLALREALLVHDRITDADLHPAYDPVAGVIEFSDMTVTIDGEGLISFPDFAISIEDD